jgi:hypothetical protein
MGTRTRRRRYCKSCHRRHSGRCMRGGGDSAAANMLRVVGSGPEQYNNVFRQGLYPGQSNAIIDRVTGQRAGGRRRRKRGGTFLSSALVPASLLAASYFYSRRKGRGSRSSRRTRRRFRGGFRGNNLSVSHPLSPAPYPGN